MGRTTTRSGSQIEGISRISRPTSPPFETTIAYTRLTAAGALKELEQQGFAQEQLPSASTMAEILNRMGYRLRKVMKAKLKKVPATNEIFNNINRHNERL